MPGIFDRCGCHESAQTPFSDETQIPSGVLMQSDWLPSVWPGVETSAIPTPSSTSPSISTRLSSIDVVHPARHVPGPLHRMDRAEGVDLLALADEPRAWEERGPRLRLAVERLRRPHQDAHVLDVLVVERDVVNIGDGESAARERLGHRVVLLREDVVREEVAVAVGELTEERRFDRPLGDGGLPGERLEPAVEVVELDHDEAVRDRDVGVESAGRAGERELRRIPGGREIDGADRADLALLLEAGSELVRRGTDRVDPLAARPGAVRLVEFVERPEADRLWALDCRHCPEAYPRAL